MSKSLGTIGARLKTNRVKANITFLLAVLKHFPKAIKGRANKEDEFVKESSKRVVDIAILLVAYAALLGYYLVSTACGSISPWTSICVTMILFGLPLIFMMIWQYRMSRNYASWENFKESWKFYLCAIFVDCCLFVFGSQLFNFCPKPWNALVFYAFELGFALFILGLTLLIRMGKWKKVHSSDKTQRNLIFLAVLLLIVVPVVCSFLVFWLNILGNNGIAQTLTRIFMWAVLIFIVYKIIRAFWAIKTEEKDSHTDTSIVETDQLYHKRPDRFSNEACKQDKHGVDQLKELRSTIRKISNSKIYLDFQETYQYSDEPIGSRIATCNFNRWLNNGSSFRGRDIFSLNYRESHRLLMEYVDYCLPEGKHANLDNIGYLEDTIKSYWSCTWIKERILLGDKKMHEPGSEGPTNNQINEIWLYCNTYSQFLADEGCRTEEEARKYKSMEEAADRKKRRKEAEELNEEFEAMIDNSLHASYADFLEEHLGYVHSYINARNARKARKTEKAAKKGEKNIDDTAPTDDVEANNDVESTANVEASNDVELSEVEKSNNSGTPSDNAEPNAGATANDAEASSGAEKSSED